MQHDTDIHHDGAEPATPLFPELTSSEYGALVALATRRSIEIDASPAIEGAGPGTAAYVEHRLVLLGLAMRVAESDNDSRSVLILSTAGRMLVHDVQERDCSSGTPSSANRERVAHDFSQWSLRPPRGRRRHAKTPAS